MTRDEGVEKSAADMLRVRIEGSRSLLFIELLIFRVFDNADDFEILKVQIISNPKSVA